jgi:RecA-family ATPase
MIAQTAADFSGLMRPVALKLLGEPNRHLSRNGTLRWGNHGSLKVDVEPGVWHDKEADQGGGVLDLIMREQQCDKAGALSWLEREGLIEAREAANENPRFAWRRDNPPFPEPKRPVSTFYDYADEHGEVRYRIERIEQGEVRKFLQHGPDGRGGFHAAKDCMAGVAPLPYRLPELLAADPAETVFICEGEKDADRLASLGLVATTNSGGGGNWKSELNHWFAGRRCVLLEDNDEKGRKHVAKVAAELEGVVECLPVLRLPGLPEKGDVSDWLDAGNSLDELLRLAGEALAASGPDLLPVIDPASWDGCEAPPRRWAVKDWIPQLQATLLTGKGGVGKSLLAQQLCTCVALGAPFLGVETVQRPALYVSCEDDADELHRRQKAICSALGVNVAALSAKLFLVSLSGQVGNELATFDASERLVIGPRYREIEATVKAHGIGFAALDNASHLMAGDHNSLHQVAAFLGLLNRLAQLCDGATLILHHPNKAGDDWLGSVAWENQVRSRLMLKPGDTPGDNDTRVLENPKANYSPRGGQIDFRWFKGAFRRDEDMPRVMADEVAANAAANFDNDIFLSCLRERNKQRRAVSEKHSPTFAPTIFAGMAESKKIGKRRLQAAMDRLYRIGAIERAELWKGDDRKPVYGLRETAGDTRIGCLEVRATHTCG